MRTQKLPPDWTEKQIQEVIRHNDHQPDEEVAQEIEAVDTGDDTTLVEVPTEFVGQVQELLRTVATSRR